LYEQSDSIVLGGLYHERHKTKRSDWVIKATEELKKKYDLRLFMFGTPKNPGIPMIDKYFYQPNISDKNVFYNMISIWLSPTYLEGLHIVPQEVMLTECPVVGTDNPMSGMHDYLKHEKTGLVSLNDLKSFRRRVEELIVDEEKRRILGYGARKQILSMGDRKKNMLELVKVMESKL
jgi:glycosyltransferase involved in cell wall biosynthesis